MGKTKDMKKEKKSNGVKAAAPLESVKNGRVSKTVSAPLAKTKVLAQAVVSKKDKKKKAAPATNDSESSDSEDDSDASDASDDSVSDDEVPAAKVNGASKKVEVDSDDSDSDSDESDEEAKPAVNGKANGASKEAEAESSDDSEDDSASGSSADSEEEDDTKAAAEPPSKKRKALEESPFAAKKAKAEEPTNDGSPVAPNLFIGNLSWGVDEPMLQAEFEGFGEISNTRIVTDKQSGRSKGFGYVEFTNLDDAKKAHEAMQGHFLDGRKLNVDFSTPRPPKDFNSPGQFSQQRASKFGDQRSPPSNTLFIGNISFEANNEIVMETFAPYGTVNRVSLPTDRESGNLKGFGYVDFETVEESTAALEALNGVDIAGRRIRVDFAGPRPDNGGGDRGGRGGFGGGRGGGRGRGGDRGFGGRGGGRGGRGDRGGRGGFNSNSTNRGGFGDFKGSKKTFD